METLEGLSINLILVRISVTIAVECSILQKVQTVKV